MKKLLTIAAILMSFCSYGQIFQKSTTNNAWNRVKADSAMYAPLDTFQVRPATQLGQPVGDSGRIAYKNQKLYYHNGSYWVPIPTKGLPALTDSVYFDGYELSYNKFHATSDGAIMRIGGDTLLSIFRLDSTFRHFGSRGCIAKRISTNNGLSWSDAVVFYNSIYDDMNYAIGQTSTGRIVVVFRRFNGSATVDQGRIYSDDKGVTWSSYATITTTLSPGVPFGRIITGGDGAYYFNMYNDLGRAKIYRSTDGATWTEGADIFNFVDGRIPTETMIAPAGGNNMIALSRNDASPDSSYMQFTSSNNGTSWSYVGRTNMNNQLRYLNGTAPELVFDAERNLLIAFSTTRNNQINSPFKAREDSMYIYVNTPSEVISNPLAWNKKIQLGRPAPSTSVAYWYPRVCKMNNGNYVGFVTELGFPGFGSGWVPSDNGEFAGLFQFDLNFAKNGLVVPSRYTATVAVGNRLTGLINHQSDRMSFSRGIDSINYLRTDGTVRVGTLKDPNRDIFQATTYNGLGAFLIRGNSSVIMPGVVSMGNTSFTAGTGSGAPNVSYFRFMEGDGVTPSGYIGDASGGDSDIYMESYNGALQFFAAGTLGIKVLTSGFVGIKTATPTSTMHVAGSFAGAITTTGSNITLTVDHGTLIATSPLTITLPAASAAPGRIYYISNYASGGNLTLSIGVLKGGATVTSVPNNANWRLQSNGTSWYVTGE